MQSWIGTGQNLPISASQLQQVLGSGTVNDIAQKAGISGPEAAAALSVCCRMSSTKSRQAVPLRHRTMKWVRCWRRWKVSELKGARAESLQPERSGLIPIVRTCRSAVDRVMHVQASALTMT